ncbi:hypothetical protein LCGC14_1122590 [marine sediment metagenome]|uniref:Uncharacterized protein n=1 Tax=marine sediment metagenome TaxID=412755 RepID=A0A0F9M3J0_9ZZZZ
MEEFEFESYRPIIKLLDGLHTIGAIMACVVSYSVNQSIGWMIIHGGLSWFYLIFR